MTREEWEHELTMADSQHRAAVLVRALKETPEPEVKRELLAEWFNLCDALAPWADELREQLELAAPVLDGAPMPKLPTVVYRGAWGDDEIDKALSWTLDREEAENFCRRMTSVRARLIFGLDRPGVRMYVWRGTCTRAYGYLNGREESEVLAAEVVDVEPIAELLTVPVEA